MIQIDFSIPTAQIKDLGVRQIRRGVKTAIQFGGRKLYQICQSNFGSTGQFRPYPWARLSRRYAKRVGRSYPTLRVSGALYRSMVLTNGTTSFAVTATDRKASFHQRGTRTMPARPFLPKDKLGRLSPYVKVLLEKELARGFARGISR